MRSHLILFVCLLAHCMVRSQVVGTIETLDKNSLEAIPNCVVNVQSFGDIDSSFTINSRLGGPITFGLEAMRSGKIWIACSHPMYETTYKKINFTTLQKDTLEIKVFLSRIKEKLTGEVRVTAPGIPDTVFNSTEFHVADYSILDNGDFVLLAYPKRSGKQNSLFLYDGLTIKSKVIIPDEARYLVKDFRGNIHVVCNENVFSIQLQSNQISLSNVHKEYYFTYIAPIVDSATNRLFFTNINNDYPAFDYFTVDLTDSTYRRLMHIEDKLMMELYRSEYKWVDVRTRLWAKQKELETGIDAQIWVGANYFTQSIYYKMPYAPLLKIRDTLYVFDFQLDRMTVFDQKGDSIRSVPLFFHYHREKTGWKKTVFSDPEKATVYTIFEKDGISYLGRINLNNGKIAQKYMLKNKYVDLIKVHGGFVYYIYRPFESIQKRFLYRERLPD